MKTEKDAFELANEIPNYLKSRKNKVLKEKIEEYPLHLQSCIYAHSIVHYAENADNKMLKSVYKLCPENLKGEALALSLEIYATSEGTEPFCAIYNLLNNDAFKVNVAASAIEKSVLHNYEVSINILISAFRNFKLEVILSQALINLALGGNMEAVNKKEAINKIKNKCPQENYVDFMAYSIINSIKFGNENILKLVLDGHNCDLPLKIKIFAQAITFSVTENDMNCVQNIVDSCPDELKSDIIDCARNLCAQSGDQYVTQLEIEMAKLNTHKMANLNKVPKMDTQVNSILGKKRNGQKTVSFPNNLLTNDDNRLKNSKRPRFN